MFYRDRVRSVLHFEGKQGRVQPSKSSSIHDEDEEGSKEEKKKEEEEEELQTIHTKQTQLTLIAEKLLAANMASSTLSKEEQELLHEAIGDFDYARGQNNIIIHKLPWWREIIDKAYEDDKDDDFISSLKDSNLNDVELPSSQVKISISSLPPSSTQITTSKPLIEEIGGVMMIVMIVMIVMIIIYWKIQSI